MEFVGHLGFPNSNTAEVFLMYLIEFLILENLYFATNFMKLRVLELKLRLFIDICMEFGGHLGFPNLDIAEVFLMYLTEFLILENIYFDTIFIKLCALEQKLWPFIDRGGHLGGHLGFLEN